MNETTEMRAGWTAPFNARKAHYFPANEGTSACGKWTMFHRSLAQVGLNRAPESKCATCKREAGA